jgi:hypothetical protein
VSRYLACLHCGHPVPPDGVTLDPSQDEDVTGQDRPRCDDTACVCSTPVVTLGRDGMGASPTPDDFEGWVTYAREHLDAACGLPVETIAVGEHQPRDVQKDLVRYWEDDVCETIRDALAELWERWCVEAPLVGAGAIEVGT